MQDDVRRAGWRGLGIGFLLGLLFTGLLAAGCGFSGGPIRFSEPAGGTVRLGGGFAHRIPWETSVSKGAHELVISPHGRGGFLGLTAGEDAVKGWLVVVGTWDETPAELFSVESIGLSLEEGVVTYGTGSTPDGRTAFQFKGSKEGVSRGDRQVKS
jgi:hypothetical protein